MGYFLSHFPTAKKSLALALTFVMAVAPVFAGITLSPTDGIVMTGADGIVMTGADGIVMTGADSFLNTSSNGIVMTGADGIVMTGADGIVMTGADGFAYPNSIRTTSADGVDITRADGIVMTGADGIVMTGADGSHYTADSVTLTLANGIVMTGADGIVMTGADGVRQVGSDGIVMTGADGIVMTGADGIVMTGADSLRAVGADGVFYTLAPAGMTFTGVTGIVMTGADGIVMTGADGIVMTGADGTFTVNNTGNSISLQSVDPELLAQLNQLTDDSTINAVVVYHHLPTAGDLDGLRAIGINGGTKFHVLPMVIVSGTRNQIAAISRLSGVRSIYGNRTLSLTSEPEVRAATGVDRTWRDTEITQSNQNINLSGRGITVAVLDTGIDGAHGDLSGRVAKNVKLFDQQSASNGFNYPLNSENLTNTDQVYGHGTFVAGLIGGSGSLSGGKYSGVAPGARLVGLSAGDLSLLYVLNGFDYLLANTGSLGVRVVNCSFSANTLYDGNDPVNVATRMLTEDGINVVFSAGNTGPGAHSLNPYAVAPWVISVGATDTQGRLASFSSRGDFASGLFKPTLVAPGYAVVSVRGSGIVNVTGAEGLAGADAQRLSSSDLPYYTVASGTSFSAPQVAGTIALMLEANPNLTPAEVREILQRTATPLSPYYAYEVGAGMLNVHAAVLQSAFMSRKIGTWRGTLDRGQIQFVNDPLTTFSGNLQPGTAFDKSVQIPENTLLASMQIAWGPLWTTNDLSLSLYDATGTLKGQANTLNLPGLNGRRERLTLNTPSPGAWKASVRNTLGALGTTQTFYGVLELGRARYARMVDVDTASPTLRSDIYQSLRTFSMWPIGTRFRAEWAVSRSDLASALVMGGRVPQYLPSRSNYQDVRDEATTLFVESAQGSPTGSLFIDALPGGKFRPNDNVTRLIAAVALVRAAGLRSEAETKAGAPLAFLDALSIPTDLRGYVSVAVARGLLAGDTLFRPEAGLTRGELAHALAVIQKRAVQ